MGLAEWINHLLPDVRGSRFEPRSVWKYHLVTPKPLRLPEEPGAPPDLWIEWRRRGKTKKDTQISTSICVRNRLPKIGKTALEKKERCFHEIADAHCCCDYCYITLQKLDSRQEKPLTYHWTKLTKRKRTLQPRPNHATFLSLVSKGSSDFQQNSKLL